MGCFRDETVASSWGSSTEKFSRLFAIPFALSRYIGNPVRVNPIIFCNAIRHSPVSLMPQSLLLNVFAFLFASTQRLGNPTRVNPPSMQSHSCQLTQYYSIPFSRYPSYFAIPFAPRLFCFAVCR